LIIYLRITIFIPFFSDWWKLKLVQQNNFFCEPSLSPTGSKARTAFTKHFCKKLLLFLQKIINHPHLDEIHLASLWLLISSVFFCGLVQFLQLYCTTSAMNSNTASNLANAVARLGRNDATLTDLNLRCKWHSRNGNTYAGFMLTTRTWLHIDYRLERKALLL
jgi:hypothetical protein